MYIRRYLRSLIEHAHLYARMHVCMHACMHGGMYACFCFVAVHLQLSLFTVSVSSFYRHKSLARRAIDGSSVHTCLLAMLCVRVQSKACGVLSHASWALEPLPSVAR